MSKSNGSVHKSTREENQVLHHEPVVVSAAPSGEAETGGNLDKVRDILFGAQVREAEKRQQRLEDRLLKELGEIREEFRRRHDSLDAFVRQELESLNERLGTERGLRIEATDALSKEAKDSSTAVHKRLLAFDEQLNKSQRDLRQQLLEQSSRFADDLRIRTEDVTQLLASSVDELRTEKASRSSLASLFGELAMRINGEQSSGVPE